MKTAIERFTAARACAEHAPEGTYNATKELLAATGAAMDSLIRAARGVGLRPCNADGAYAAEAALYAWLTKDSDQAAVAEGFGEHSQGPAAERVIAQAARDRDALARIKQESPT